MEKKEIKFSMIEGSYLMMTQREFEDRVVLWKFPCHGSSTALRPFTLLNYVCVS